MADLSAIVKAYDIRGVVGDGIDQPVVRALGAALARLVRDESRAVVVGHDMRPSSPALARAFAEGVTGQGLDVVDIGLASTDQLYFASGSLDLPGAMFTASHNPAQYNGIKLCRAGAVPIGQGTGLDTIRDDAQAGVPAGPGGGTVTSRDVLRDYAEHLRGLVGPPDRPLRVVVDAGNGMAGHTVPAVLGRPLDVLPLYFELDGTFPNHEANPLDPANLVDLQKAVVAEGADLGLAFDGDADRCFVVDERGEAVSPSAVTALVAVRALAEHPGAVIIHNCITSRAVPELVTEHGGTPVRTRVGHSFIKATMAQTGAVFGGEHSAHYYFRDFWKADSGMLAALHVLAALGEAERPLSELMAGYERYAASGEVNSTVADVPGRVAAVRAAYAHAEFDELDGLTASLPDGSWFNLRPSNTEPLLRLNVEAADATAVAALRDDVLAIVRGRDMPLDARLLEILACPTDDHAPVEQRGDTLVCTACGRAYPIVDGIPVLLLEEAVDPGTGAVAVVLDDLTDPRALAALDGRGVLRSAATAGAQVRSAAQGALEAGVAQLAGRPRALVFVRRPGTSGAAAALLGALLGPSCPVPVVVAEAVPAWIGPLDVVVVHTEDGTDAELAESVALAVRRGAEVVASVPAAGPVAAAGAGRARLVEPRIPVPPGLDLPRALAVGLAVLRALGLLGVPLDPAMDVLADALDAEAERNQPGHEPFMNPAKSLALRMAERTPLLWGADPLATAVAGHAATALAQHAGVVAHSADAAQGLTAGGLLRALGARDVFRDPFDDPSPEAPAPRLVLLATGEDDPVQAVLRRTGRGLPDPDVLHPVDEVVRGTPHAALLRAVLLASRCDVAAVYLGLATRAIEPA